MRKIWIILLLTLFVPMASWAQKEVRENIREANKAYNEQRYGVAEGKYQEALKKNPSSKEASFNLANTYYRQQKWDDALKEYERYLMIEKDDPIKAAAAWTGAGNTFLKKKSVEKYLPKPPKGEEQDYLKLSMEAYKKALRLNPKDDETRHNLAVVQKLILDQQSNGGGGQDQQQNQNKDNNKDNKDQQQQDQNQNDKQNKDKQNPKDQNDDDGQNKMSQDNMDQILNALQQEEKNTQERVNQAKIKDQERRNAANRNQNKDW